MATNLRKNRNPEAGFTLMELIVVLVILGMLAAVVGPKLIGRISGSRDQIARMEIGNLEGALQIYSFDTGRFPTTAEGLQALLQNPTGAASWKGPYLKKLPNDPWERPYIYKSPGEHGDFDICSAGADGAEGTADDVCNWE